MREDDALVAAAPAAGPDVPPADPGGAFLTADELLAGAALRHAVEVPTVLLDPARPGTPGRVRLKPLTVADLQRVSRAARENDGLVAALMVMAALDEPKLGLAQIHAMPVGLLEFLLGEVNRISGLAVEPEAVADAAAQPIARAAHLLAARFGWTPEQVNALTLGQIQLHLQLLRDAEAGRG